MISLWCKKRTTFLRCRQWKYLRDDFGFFYRKVFRLFWPKWATAIHKPMGGHMSKSVLKKCAKLNHCWQTSSACFFLSRTWIRLVTRTMLSSNLHGKCKMHMGRPCILCLLHRMGCGAQKEENKWEQKNHYVWHNKKSRYWKTIAPKNHTVKCNSCTTQKMEENYRLLFFVR